MKSVDFFVFFLLFLVACAVVPPKPQEPSKPSGNQFLENAAFCNVDADCTCGGIDKNTDNCFVGNKLYASKNVDMSKDCPDFCTGIAAHLETKCVNNECKNVPREGWNEQECKHDDMCVAIMRDKKAKCVNQACIIPSEEQVMCTQDAKECPDGSYVARVGPSCEFAPCPEASLSNAHWLCEDTSWKEAPEDCFENYCTQKGDCQLMGVTGICGPYMIAGPTKTLHKPPVFYADRCGAEQCSVATAMCIDPKDQPRINGFDCVDTKCVVRTVQ